MRVYTYDQMEQTLVGKVIATALRQLGFFMVILAVVSTAIIALIIYTMTMGKIKEIAVFEADWGSESDNRRHDFAGSLGFGSHWF